MLLMQISKFSKKADSLYGASQIHEKKSQHHAEKAKSDKNNAKVLANFAKDAENFEKSMNVLARSKPDKIGANIYALKEAFFNLKLSTYALYDSTLPDRYNVKTRLEGYAKKIYEFTLSPFLTKKKDQFLTLENILKEAKELPKVHKYLREKKERQDSWEWDN
ncbi:MAG: hypothetical protein ABIH83_01925 [Candidatus Micrarchaeota archaeon]